MRIAQIVSTYPPYRGGMGNVAAGFATELRGRGQEIKVFTPLYTNKSEVHVQEGVEHIKPLFKVGNSAFIPGLYKELKGFDLLHLHYPFYGGVESVLWFKKRNPKIPLVVTYHMDNIGSGLFGSIFKAYKKTILPALLKKTDAVTVSSLDYAQNSFLEPYLNALNVVEIPFGVDIHFKPTTERDNEKIFEILFVGGLDRAHYFKGLEYLINALALLVETKSEVLAKKKLRLNIIGDGDMRHIYEKQVARKKITEYVKFSGKISDQELVEAYQHADLTVLPSIDSSEAFGVVLIESMACGTPVIASNLPGVRSVVSEETGILVPPAKVMELAYQIENLIKDEDRLKKMRQAAAERVETNYRWPKIIDKLERLYKDLV